MEAITFPASRTIMEAIKAVLEAAVWTTEEEAQAETIKTAVLETGSDASDPFELAARSLLDAALTSEDDAWTGKAMSRRAYMVRLVRVCVEAASLEAKEAAAAAEPEIPRPKYSAPMETLANGGDYEEEKIGAEDLHVMLTYEAEKDARTQRLKDKPLPTQLGRIPFQLIEDILEGSPTAECEQWWDDILAANEDLLTAPELFGKGKFYTLRFCNGLLKRLSRTRDACFCGKILFFLARAYPLSEKSAVNVKGDVHSDLTALYEDEATFLEKIQEEEDAPVVESEDMVVAARDDDDDDDDEEKKADDDDDEDLPKQKKRRRVAAPRKEDEEQQKGKKRGREEDDATKEVNDETVEDEKKKQYAEYEGFWKVQRWLGDPTLAMKTDSEREPMFEAVETTLKTLAESAFTADEAARLVEQFERQKKLVKPFWDRTEKPPAFEPLNLGPWDTEYEKKKKAMEEGPSYEELYTPEVDAQLKKGPFAIDSNVWSGRYLTDSRLLKTQLKDPIVRLQVLTQIFIVFDYYAHEVPEDDTASKNFKARALKVRDRVMTAMENSPPNGKHHAMLVKNMSNHEHTFWIPWKKDGCPPIEKVLEPPPKMTKREPWQRPNLEKLREADIQRDAKRKKKPYDHDKLEDLLDAIEADVVRLQKDIPTLGDHLQRWIDADDPENAIEEEFHPKHDQLYCFQARRLILRERPFWFQHMPTGDLAVAVKLFQDEQAGTVDSVVPAVPPAEDKKDDAPVPAAAPDDDKKDEDTTMTEAPPVVPPADDDDKKDEAPDKEDEASKEKDEAEKKEDDTMKPAQPRELTAAEEAIVAAFMQRSNLNPFEELLAKPDEFIYSCGTWDDDVPAPAPAKTTRAQAYDYDFVRDEMPPDKKDDKQRAPDKKDDKAPSRQKPPEKAQLPREKAPPSEKKAAPAPAPAPAKKSTQGKQSPSKAPERPKRRSSASDGSDKEKPSDSPSNGDKASSGDKAPEKLEKPPPKRAASTSAAAATRSAKPQQPPAPKKDEAPVPAKAPATRGKPQQPPSEKEKSPRQKAPAPAPAPSKSTRETRATRRDEPPQRQESSTRDRDHPPPPSRRGKQSSDPRGGGKDDATGFSSPRRDDRPPPRDDRDRRPPDRTDSRSQRPPRGSFDNKRLGPPSRHDSHRR